MITLAHSPLNPEAPVTPNVPEAEAAQSWSTISSWMLKRPRQSSCSQSWPKLNLRTDTVARSWIEVEDRVLLSTKHRCREYMQVRSGCSANYSPLWPALYGTANPHQSSYTLHLPNEPNCFPLFILLSCIYLWNNNQNVPITFTCDAKPGCYTWWGGRVVGREDIDEYLPWSGYSIWSILLGRVWCREWLLGSGMGSWG